MSNMLKYFFKNYIKEQNFTDNNQILKQLI